MLDDIRYIITSEMNDSTVKLKLGVTKRNLEMVVLNNQKQRYELISKTIDGLQIQLIRAVQGHIIKEIEDCSLGKYKIILNFHLPYTSYDEWNKIQQSGISRKGRNHIYFAIGLLTEDFLSVELDCQVKQSQNQIWKGLENNCYPNLIIQFIFNSYSMQEEQRLSQNKEVEDSNYDKLARWFHNDYIPNCWMKHLCQTCQPESYVQKFKKKQKKQCKHDVQFMKESIRDLEIYGFLPKGIIQYQCIVCQARYNQIHSAQNRLIYQYLHGYAAMLFNQGQNQDDDEDKDQDEDYRNYCIFRYLNIKIFFKAYQLSQKTLNQVFQFIKILKSYQKHQDKACIFEKYFLQYTQIIGMKNGNDINGYKLEILCKYKQYAEIYPALVKSASMSQNYIAFIVKKYCLQIYDIQKGNIIMIKLYGNAIFKCLFTGEGRYLYISFYENATIIILDVKNGFQKTKRKNLFDHKGQETNIMHLKYSQYIVQMQRNNHTYKKYIHFDSKRNKMIAVHKKPSQYCFSQSAYDGQNNCILHLSRTILLAFCIIRKDVIFYEDVGNAGCKQYLLGGNKILELDEKQRLSQLTINYESQYLKRQFIEVNVQCFGCSPFQQYYYNQQDKQDQFTFAFLQKGTVYSVYCENYRFGLDSYNILLENKFLINDEKGISFNLFRSATGYNGLIRRNE